MDPSQASCESTRIWRAFNRLRKDILKTQIGRERALESYIRNKLHSDKAHIADYVLEHLKAKLNQHLPYGSGPTVICELREMLQGPQTTEKISATTSAPLAQLVDKWVKNSSSSITTSISSSSISISTDSPSTATVRSLLHKHLSDATTYMPPLTTASSSSMDSNTSPQDYFEPLSSSKRGRCTFPGSLQESTSAARASSTKRARLSTEDSYESIYPNILELQNRYKMFRASQKMFRAATQAIHDLTKQRLKLSSLLLQATVDSPRQSGEQEPDMLELFPVAEDITFRIVELSLYVKQRLDCVGRP